MRVSGIQLGTRQAISPTMAYKVKLHLDLSGNRYFLAGCHDAISGLTTIPELEDMREVFSQVIKNGATGFWAWPNPGRLDGGGLIGTSVESAYPSSWEYTLKTQDWMYNMPKLKKPSLDEAKTGIFFSHDSVALDSPSRILYEYAYTQLGPRTRGWFRFLSEWSIKYKKDKLSNYKILYLPFISHYDDETLRAIENYVKAGGTLVCTDQTAFSFKTDATPVQGVREKLFGVEVGDVIRPKKIIFPGAPYGTESLDMHADRVLAYKLKALKGTKVLATFDTGSPAIVEHKLGRGKTYFFASTTQDLSVLADEKWQTMLKKFHASLGGKVDYDFWRFRLPLWKVPEHQFPEGACLTGNYGYWDKSLYIKGVLQNKDIKGTYTVTHGAESKDFAFGEGPLGNRHHILDDPDSSISRRSRGWQIEKWAEVIKDKGPVAVTYDFKRAVKAQKVRLYYRGHPASIKVETSAGGKAWAAVGQAAGIKDTGERSVFLSEVSLSLKGYGSARFLRVVIDHQSEGELILPELEVWGKE